MPSVWDHAADKNLLLTIIELGSLSKVDWVKVSDMMTQKKYAFSHEACRQHYQKIRKESRNGGSTTSTPSKPREAKTTPASRRATKSFGNVVADDDEELFQTPTKKQKTGVKKKEEQDDVDYGGFLGQTAAQVKFENGTDHYIDVDNDDFYDQEV